MADDRAASDGGGDAGRSVDAASGSAAGSGDESEDGGAPDSAGPEEWSTGDPAETWREVFGFAEPYESQTDAIETAIEVGQRGGYFAMEGPCGTGKTMAALTAGATLVRTTRKYDRVLVVTPVKQQRLQFVEDLRTMNARLAADPDRPDPLDGVALVGKRDLCPYGREGAFPDDASTHDRCEDLRETTADLVEADRRSGDEPAADAALAADPEDVWWDPSLASDLVREARMDADTYRTFDSALETAGAESPYPRSQPSAPESMTAGDDEPLYCPFEADWFARNKGSPVDFSVGESRVVTADDYLPASVERGTCPHRAMGVMLEHADVIVGNYNHVFDPGSRPLVSAALDSSTFLVVDEAHRLEERVRDLLSDRVGRSTIKRARNDCNHLLSRARESRDRKQQVRDRLASHDVPLSALDQAREFYDDLLGWLDERVERYLDEEVERDWRVGDPTESVPERDVEVPLRDPEEPEPDELTRWAERQGYDGEVWRTLATVGAAVEDAIDGLGLARQPVCAAVGAVMGHWWERGHDRYLREIELEYAPKTGQAADAVDRDYQRVYTPGLVLFDCMPAESLKEIFDSLGGGVLMSATLSPLDVFTEVSGLESLREGDPNPGPTPDDGDHGRPVEAKSYPLRFPEENRASWTVDAEPFTARNRGNPAEMEPLGDGWNRTRDEYAHVLRSVARSPGNVLVAMPNYREAEWAGAYLDGAVDKPVLVDESSSNEATEQLKAEFFRGGGKVLVTSTRGTLTEGVDYDGEKLAAALVIGVPLVNVGSPRVRAVQRAYADEFGEDNAFAYALTVPAVRRARQAIGRVIRGTDEVGVRVFADRRYTAGAPRSVHEYLSPAEREEFVRMTAEFLDGQLDRFWEDRSQ
ncbi:ATP-dependent DNA helicase [Halosimplex halophilum]|uniref:ATP-dependent DNA helicase n=1 Tax=Halosimplex halophilum TaxID=2559572 RepID=UPI001FE729A2|nr:ATP-dependent DNA helicase [Halosimplex halophilum]